MAHMGEALKRLQNSRNPSLNTLLEALYCCVCLIQPVLPVQSELPFRPRGNKCRHLRRNFLLKKPRPGGPKRGIACACRLRRGENTRSHTKDAASPENRHAEWDVMCHFAKRLSLDTALGEDAERAATAELKSTLSQLVVFDITEWLIVPVGMKEIIVPPGDRGCLVIYGALKFLRLSQSALVKSVLL